MKNKNILIVGGTSGIGFYLSKKLAKSNNVSVLGRNKQVLKNLKLSGINSINFDLRELNKTNSVFKNVNKKFGKLDALIFSAGIQNIKPFKLINEKEIDDMIKINFQSVMIFASFFAKNLYSNKNSIFLAISSSADTKPEKGIVAYSAVKAGLSMFVRALSLEIAPRRAIALSPGWLDTEMTQKFPYIYDKSFKIKYSASAPMGIASLKDIHDIILFLISNKSKFLNGETIPFDGGAKYC